MVSGDTTAAVPARLREAREYVGLTREDAAGALGCTPLLVESMETGEAVLFPEMLRRLARLYRRPAEWLCGQSGFQPSAGQLRLVENLGDGDREAVLDFMEFLHGAGPAPTRKAGAR
jgi:transcriptional regulator with XRE-family HTH domain